MPMSEVVVKLNLTADSLINNVIQQSIGNPHKSPIISGDYLYYYDLISLEIFRFNFKLSNQTPEVVIPSIYRFRAMVIKDNILYVASDNTVSTFDLNQDNPSFETLIDEGTVINSMVFYGNELLFFSNASSGYDYLSKINPLDASPQITPLINMTAVGTATALATYENILFAALEYENAIVRYDLDDYTKITEPIKQNISVSPIPAKDVISVNNIEPNGIANIIDVSGKLVSTVRLNGNRLNISHLTNGIYFIEIQDNKQLFHVKFIKE